MSKGDTVIMFADVVGSTALYEQVGDTEAQRIVAAALKVVRDVADAHSGEVVAELGDESMVLFADPGDAAASACDVHAKIAERIGFEDTGISIRMRIGMHMGPLDKDDPMASETGRIGHWAASNAKADQTLATEAIIDKLPRIYQAVSRYVDDETWNFVSIEHVALHEIIWDVESVTAFAGEKPTMESQRIRATRFHYLDQAVVLSKDRPVISAGRSPQNDLVMNTDLVSRQHFSAQYSRGRCTVTDNSTNGTKIIGENGEEHTIKKETFPLNGSGKLILGSPPEPEDRYIVTFDTY